MSLARRLRTAGAVAIVAIGVPTLVIGGMRHTAANTLTPTTTTGSSVPTIGGSTAKTATSGSSAGTNTTSSGSGTTSGNLPADKMTVAASTFEISGPNADVTLLSAQMRTSNPADLLFQVTSECSIVTKVTTMGNDTQTASGQIRMWVTIDGHPVGVVSNGSAPADDGKVVFCNRVYSSTTSGYVADQPEVQTYESTKAANAFNWVAFNVGNGIHTIQLHAELTEPTADTSNASSEMVVGDRTLVVNTTETAQNQAP
jgi:hypothetical protein